MVIFNTKQHFGNTAYTSQSCCRRTYCSTTCTTDSGRPSSYQCSSRALATTGRGSCGSIHRFRSFQHSPTSPGIRRPSLLGSDILLASRPRKLVFGNHPLRHWFTVALHHRSRNDSLAGRLGVSPSAGLAGCCAYASSCTEHRQSQAGFGLCEE